MTITEFSPNTEFENLIKATLIDQEQQQQTEEMTMVPEKTHNESAKSPDFFQNNNATKKKFFSKLYTTTRIKSRKFISNISHVGINKEDFYNKNFVFDIYTLLTKNLNPFSLDRKLNDQKKHEMIYMLWKECMPSDFYRYIFTKENFLYLNGKNVLYPKVAEIIWKFIRFDEKNYNKLRNDLCQFKNIFQYVYSNVYPEVYCSAERRGFDLRSTFHLLFKTYKGKEKLEQSGKNLQKCTIERNESFAFELKPIEIDMFNDKKENEVKESVEKRKKRTARGR